MSSLLFGAIVAGCAAVGGLLLLRLLMGEWIWETHNKERDNK